MNLWGENTILSRIIITIDQLFLLLLLLSFNYDVNKLRIEILGSLKLERKWNIIFEEKTHEILYGQIVLLTNLFLFPSLLMSKPVGVHVSVQLEIPRGTNLWGENTWFFLRT
jgi:hypothetical protein